MGDAIRGGLACIWGCRGPKFAGPVFAAQDSEYILILGDPCVRAETSLCLFARRIGGGRSECCVGLVPELVGVLCDVGLWDMRVCSRPPSRVGAVLESTLRGLPQVIISA